MMAVEGRCPSAQMSQTAVGVIFAATLGCFISVTPTIIAIMGVFLKPIAAEFGWPRSEVAGALASVALGNAIAYPFAGRLADRFGPRRIALIGNLSFGISIFLISKVPANLAIYYLAFFFAGALSAMPSTLVFAKLIAEWFDHSRGLWMGFCAGVGIGLGSIFLPMFGAFILSSHGWRSGFVGVAALTLIGGFTIMLPLLREAPRRKAQQAAETVVLEGVTYREAMRSPQFWWIFSSVPLGAGCMTAMFSTIVPMLTDRGLPISEAIIVIQTFAFTTIFAQPTVGGLADRLSSPKIIAPLFLTAAAGLWLLLHAQSEWSLLLAGLLIGVGAGAEYTVLPFLLSRYFGLREFGAISGVAYTGELLFSALAPLFLNGVFDWTGQYDIAIYAIIGVLLYSCVVILSLRSYNFATRRRAAAP